MVDIKNPRDLIAFQKSIEYASAIRRIVLSFPEYEQDVLTDQLRRSATSVPSNIAEGNPQDSLKNVHKHYNIALCSLRESQSQLELAYVAGYICRNTFLKLDDQAEEIARLLWVLMSKIKDQITKKEDES